MNQRIFIPETCRVGFQKRDGTFDGKLAYVIYYDSLGKLRKEASWEHWRHKDIEPLNFKNEPTSGFVLNKGIRRFNWSHFGSSRSMIRIYDPRGMEFEVTPENLIGLLMHTDCSHREVQGDLVYAWIGTELMLMPCASEEYEKAKNFTKLQAKKVNASELQEGFTYVTKQEEQLVYLGRHMWFETDRYWSRKYRGRYGEKHHIFCDLEGKEFKPIKSVSGQIAAVVDEHCHDQFSIWVDNYLKSPRSAKIVGWAEKSLQDDAWQRFMDDMGMYSRMNAFVRLGGYSYGVEIKKNWRHANGGHTTPYYAEGATFSHLTYNLNYKFDKDGNVEGMSDHNERCVTDRSGFFQLIAVYENGAEKEWTWNE